MNGTPSSVPTSITGVATRVVDVLPPVMLMIVILNLLFIATAGYIMLQIEAYRAEDRKVLGNIIDKCVGDTVPIAYLKLQMDQKK